MEQISNWLFLTTAGQWTILLLYSVVAGIAYKLFTYGKNGMPEEYAAFCAFIWIVMLFAAIVAIPALFTVYLIELVQDKIAERKTQTPNEMP